MDISHLLLERPWEYDCKIIHYGLDNTYQFIWEAHKILLRPSKDVPTTFPPIADAPTPPPLSAQTTIICSYETFKSELHKEGMAFALVTAPPAPLTPSLLHKDIDAVLNKLQDVFPTDFPTSLPP